MASAFEMAHEQDHGTQERAMFIAALAHDLRTPLTVLTGAADLLLRESGGSLTPEQRLLVEAMRRHTEVLTEIVNDALARLE
jgi:signal transduction histidine kinase